MSTQNEPGGARAGDPGGPPTMPGWVKVLLVVVLVILLAVVAAALLGGEHGPGRHGHARSADPAESAAASAADP